MKSQVERETDMRFKIEEKLRLNIRAKQNFNTLYLKEFGYVSVILID